MASTSSEVLVHDNLLDQFCAITGSDRENAEKMLMICRWNLEMAINMQVDQDLSSSGITTCSFPAPPVPNTDHKSLDSNHMQPTIPPSRDAIVDDDYTSHSAFHQHRRRTRSAFDGFRYFPNDARLQELNYESTMDPVIVKKRKTLEDLFRPPLDLIHRGSFESAREAGQISTKWLMVNIQDAQEFPCQVLNRDVWSNEAVKKIVSEHFIFWQVYYDSTEGQRYMQFYKPMTFPYIAVIDPRTGENLAVWNQMNTKMFCDVMTSFLRAHCLSDDPVTQADHTGNLMELNEKHEIEAGLEASVDDVCIDSSFDKEPDKKLKTLNTDSGSLKSNYKKNERELDCNDKSEKWQVYLGLEEDEKTNLMLRLPDGKREALTWPSSTTIKALILFVESMGFHREEYELVTNFPYKNVCEVPFDRTLKELGLYPRNVVFVQLKNPSE